MNSKKTLLIYLFTLLAFIGNAVAQEVKQFKNFGIDNPMSYNFVRAIAQDKNGFMWFGSSEGLSRFDGHQFLSFYHDAQQLGSLSSNVISRILVDNEERMWVGTFGGGLNLYHEMTQDFTHFNAQTEAHKLTNDTINALYQDSEGKLWVGTADGLNILFNVDGLWQVKQIKQQLGNPNSLTHNTVNAVVESGGQIWVGTNGGGISIFDLSGNFIKAIKYGDANKSSYVNKFVSALFVDKQSNIWIGTEDSGLLKYSTHTGEFRHFQFSEQGSAELISNTINSIYQDSENSLWIATDNGLSIYCPIERSFTHHHHSAQNPYSLSNDYILTFFEDKNGMMWVGTFTGVNRWDPNIATFRQYSSNTDPQLENNNVTSFAQTDANSVVFSTYSGGIYKLNLETKAIEKLVLDGVFDNIRVMSLFADGNTLWAGTRASGLYSVKLQTGEIKAYVHDENDTTSISANSVTDIIRDSQGNLWVSTFHFGLNRLKDNGTFERLARNEKQPNRGPSSNHILQLLEDEQGYIWAATFGGGLSRFDPTTGQFLHLHHEKDNPTSLSDDFTWIMLLDDQQNFWVGTQASGLNMLSKENRYAENFEFTQLGSNDGMKSMTVYGIQQGHNNDIWLSTSKGISQFTPETKQFKNFGLNHGLVDLEFTHGAVFKDSKQHLYFGAGKGFNTISPQQVATELRPPEVRLTNILQLNEPMELSVPLAELESLTLGYTDKLVSFEYVGLNYADPNSTTYKYRLAGFDEAWVDAGKSRRASYTNLPSGNYQLQIIAANGDTVWSEPGLSLDITVQPAPWNTWWAYLLYALIAAVLLLGYSRFLNRKLIEEQHQREYLEQQVQEKTQEFKSKNIELELANQQLEDAATTDKITGVRSRRYLDIYIEQATQLMSQIHENILPVQRHILPRLYLVMVKLKNAEQVSNSQLVNLADYLLYSRNNEDLVIKWDDDAFVIIGYEKDDNVRELTSRLTSRFEQTLGSEIKVGVAYSFYPFNFEQPMAISWDQVSVLTEHALTVAEKNNLSWLGFYGPQSQPFDYLDVIKQHDIPNLSKFVKLKHGE